MNTPFTILLVEDDLDDQDFFINAIEQIDGVALFDVVNNGKEAIDRLRMSIILPTLIVMDIQMPLMNGLECLSEMAKCPLINTIPVIILSSSIECKAQACALGAKAFITKQYSMEFLRINFGKMLQTVLTA